VTSDSRSTIDQLADQTGVSVRTIRYYITEGLLPGPAGRGKAATYTQEHVDRLRLIRRLTEQRVPLAQQRARLSQLSKTEVRTLLSQEEERAQELRVAESESPADYVAALLRRAQAARERTSEPIFPRQREPAAFDHAFNDESEGHFPKDSWRRIELVPGLELHVRADVAGLHSGLIERLLRVARRAPRS
jgi:DNA-binding transcriptional MerR regulator